MSYLRPYSKLILLSLCLMQACFGQTTCFPLYGSDALHPNGLLLRLGQLKQPQQNTTSTYITQLSNFSQALWDATQGPTGYPGQTVIGDVKSELASCVPPIAPGSVVPPPQPVPFYNTALSVASHVMTVSDFNKDGFADIAVVVPGSNHVSVYLGNPDGTFQAAITTTVGTASTKLGAIGTADFNSDRKQDIAVVDTVNGVVYVLFGRGDGNFVNPVMLTVGKSPASLTLGDVNADGFADIITSNTGDNTVSVIRGNGDGTFLPATVPAVGKAPMSAIVADINRDGNMDIVVADSGSNDLAVLFGYGNGGFQTAIFVKAPAPPSYLIGADFNNDGFPDVVALSEDMNTVTMFAGAFQGKLTAGSSYLVPNLTASLTANDFDGDGNLDLLIPDTDRGSPVLLLGRGDGTFTAPPVYLSSNGLTSLATGDFNNDGKADLIVTGSNANTSTLSLLSGLGNGLFQAPVNIPVPGRTDVVAVGDFNKDGLLDIAVSGTQLNILLNQNNGTFRQGGQYPNVIPAIVADFNKDGVLDIAGPANGALVVMLGNGDGTFRTGTPTPVGSNPTTAVAADFNKDGNLDVAVLNAGTVGNPSDQGGISILLGNGSGIFPKGSLLAVNPNPRAIATADLDGDGKADLVVATSIPVTGTPVANAATYQISVLRGNGDGTFQTAFNVPLPAGETPNTIAILDVDGDGKLDVVVGDCCADGSTRYLRGNGDGTLQPPVAFYGGNNPRTIAVGDWNGDGKPDMAIAYSPADNPAMSGVVPLVNRLTSAAAAVMTVTSGASFATGPMAPDSIESLFGPTLTTGTASATGDPSSLPTSLSNTSVTVKDSKGAIRTAQLYFVSPTQINFLVPAATALGQATVSVIAPNGVTTSQVNTIATFPGMFTANPSGLAAATGVHVQGPYYSSFNVSYVDPNLGVVPLPINMGAKNDQIFLSLYGTGFRSRTSPDGVVVTIGGKYTPTLYAGPQTQYPGLDQLNIQIPQSLSGAGNVVIQVTVDGIAANQVYVNIQ